MGEIFALEFMRHAFIAGLFVSLLMGVVGSLIVVNRMVFLAGGIAHSAYGGIGLALYLGLPIFLGALGFALLCALLVGYVSLHAKHRIDTFIGIVWAAGMAIGVIAIDATPGYHADMSGYLFGSILAVGSHDLWLIGGVSITSVLVVILRYREFLAVSYDAQHAMLRGIAVKRYHLALLALSALGTVVAIHVVGIILVVALLTIPVYIAEKISSTLWSMMWIASAIAAFFVTTGLIISYFLDLSSGAVIILVATLFIGIFSAIYRLRR